MGRDCILVVGDEEDIPEPVRCSLVKDGYRVLAAFTADEALNEAKHHAPDLILLDLMQQGLDGMDVCRRLKANSDTNHIPVIIMGTAKTQDADIVEGLELGAEAYITKPLSPRVLLAWLRAVLRRKKLEQTSESTLLVHDLAIHVDRHEVLVRGHTIPLTATEFSILHYLARRPGRVFSRDEIIKGAKGIDYPVTARAVDVQIGTLRKKLGDARDYIETVRGAGYRFKE